MKIKKTGQLSLNALSVFLIFQQTICLAAVPIVQPNSFSKLVFATRDELSAKEHDLIGLQFSRLARPSKMQNCEPGTEVFGRIEYIQGKEVVIFRNYRCSGRSQYWLVRPVNQFGKSLTPQQWTKSHNRAEDDNNYIIEDIFVLAKLKKTYEQFSHGCMRNEQEIGEIFPFAFAIGTTTPIYEGGPQGRFNKPGDEIGYESKNIIAAWMINIQTKKFEPMPTKNLFCSYAD